MDGNLHVSSDVIIDASMPNVIRVGGQMWNKDNKLKNCQQKGQFDYKTANFYRICFVLFIIKSKIFMFKLKVRQV